MLATYTRWAPGRQDTFLVAHASGQLYTYQVWKGLLILCRFHSRFQPNAVSADFVSISLSNPTKCSFCRPNLSAATCLLCTNSKSRVSPNFTRLVSNNFCWIMFSPLWIWPNYKQMTDVYVDIDVAQVRVSPCSQSRGRPSGIRLPGDISRYLIFEMFDARWHFEIFERS